MEPLGEELLQIIQSYTTDYLYTHPQSKLVKRFYSKRRTTTDNYKRMLTVCGITARLFTFAAIGNREPFVTEYMPVQTGVYRVSLTSRDRSFYGHAFCLRIEDSQVYIYDSYVDKHELIEEDVSKTYDDFIEAVYGFLENPNTEDWLSITGQKQFSTDRTIKQPVKLKVYNYPGEIVDVDNLHDNLDRLVTMREEGEDYFSTLELFSDIAGQ